MGHPVGRGCPLGALGAHHLVRALGVLGHVGGKDGVHHLVLLLVGAVEVAHGAVLRDGLAVHGQALGLDARRLHGMVHALHMVLWNGVDGAHAHGPGDGIHALVHGGAVHVPCGGHARRTGGRGDAGRGQVRQRALALWQVGAGRRLLLVVWEAVGARLRAARRRLARGRHGAVGSSSSGGGGEVLSRGLPALLALAHVLARQAKLWNGG